MFGPLRPPQADAPLPETPAVMESEEDKILRWRFDVLERAGYNEVQADILARARHVDLHEAVRLVEAGCPHSKAALIVL